jgi:hypothetical protein
MIVTRFVCRHVNVRRKPPIATTGWLKCRQRSLSRDDGIFQDAEETRSVTPRTLYGSGLGK